MNYSIQTLIWVSGNSSTASQLCQPPSTPYKRCSFSKYVRILFTIPAFCTWFLSQALWPKGALDASSQQKQLRLSYFTSHWPAQKQRSRRRTWKTLFTPPFSAPNNPRSLLISTAEWKGHNGNLMPLSIGVCRDKQQIENEGLRVFNSTMYSAASHTALCTFGRATFWSTRF